MPHPCRSKMRAAACVATQQLGEARRHAAGLVAGQPVGRRAGAAAHRQNRNTRAQSNLNDRISDAIRLPTEEAEMNSLIVTLVFVLTGSAAFAADVDLVKG